MKVVAGTIGTTQLFNGDLRVSQTAIDLKAVSLRGISAAAAAAAAAAVAPVLVPIGGFIRGTLIAEVKEMLKVSILANSTAFEGPSEG